MDAGDGPCGRQGGETANPGRRTSADAPRGPTGCRAGRRDAAIRSLPSGRGPLAATRTAGRPVGPAEDVPGVMARPTVFAAPTKSPGTIVSPTVRVWGAEPPTDMSDRPPAALAAPLVAGSRNRPLRTAFAPPSRDRDHDMPGPADKVVQVHSRVERRDRLRAQHGAGGIVGDLHLLARLLLSQSRKYSSRSCDWPSASFTFTWKLVAEYQASAMRRLPWGNCRARGSSVAWDQASVDWPEGVIVSWSGKLEGRPTTS